MPPSVDDGGIDAPRHAGGECGVDDGLGVAEFELGWDGWRDVDEDAGASRGG